MPNTYTQIHIQTVFSVQHRDCIIGKSWKDDLYKYMAGIIRNHGHKVLSINGMPDHVHVFFGMRPTQSLSDLMKAIKGDSSEWVNQQKFIRGKFSWQEGYGAFSYAKSQVPDVISYIQNQEQHHRTVSFLEEYQRLLLEFEVDFKEAYLFKPIDYSTSYV